MKIVLVEHDLSEPWLSPELPKTRKTIESFQALADVVKGWGKFCNWVQIVCFLYEKDLPAVSLRHTASFLNRSLSRCTYISNFWPCRCHGIRTVISQFIALSTVFDIQEGWILLVARWTPVTEVLNWWSWRLWLPTSDFECGKLISYLLSKHSTDESNLEVKAAQSDLVLQENKRCAHSQFWIANQVQQRYRANNS